MSSLVYAEHLLNLIEALNDQDLITFLQTLSAKYDIDPGALSKATVNYSKEKNQANLEKVTKSSEPLWVELFRRLNTTQDGTVKLIRLRERIRGLLKDNPEIAFFNSSLLSLFKGWFNPSFLVLEKIDWSTPANILEKIIEYEAVHEINSWDDLRARLAPDDRRCFAFFHPLIPDEPLIFVEVALCNKTPESINEVIKIDREIVNYKDINVLENPNIRVKLSEYSNWPTIPQLYIKGEFIGGCDIILDMHKSEDIDEAYLCSNIFVNTMTQQPNIDQLIPLVPQDGDDLISTHWDYIYEPEAKDLLDGLLTRYIESLVYQSVVENSACEQAAKMIAMKNATDNAGDLIKELELLYNNVRQAAITQELSEIVGGAAAV